jgi:hypothetical protein
MIQVLRLKFAISFRLGIRFSPIVLRYPKQLLPQGLHMYNDNAPVSVGAASYWLFTIGGSANDRHMRIFKDGKCVQDRKMPGFDPDPGPKQRTKFLIGKSWWK